MSESVLALPAKKKTVFLQAHEALSFPKNEAEGKKDFQACHLIVERHFKDFVEVAIALKRIKEHCLYLPEFAGEEYGADTFPNYCQKVMSSHQRGYQLLGALETRQILVRQLELGEKTVNELWSREYHLAQISKPVRSLVDEKGKLTQQGKGVKEKFEKVERKQKLDVLRAEFEAIIEKATRPKARTPSEKECEDSALKTSKQISQAFQSKVESLLEDVENLSDSARIKKQIEAAAKAVEEAFKPIQDALQARITARVVTAQEKGLEDLGK